MNGAPAATSSSVAENAMSFAVRVGLFGSRDAGASVRPRASFGPHAPRSAAARKASSARLDRPGIDGTSGSKQGGDGPPNVGDRVAVERADLEQEQGDQRDFDRLGDVGEVVARAHQVPADDGRERVAHEPDADEPS